VTHAAGTLIAIQILDGVGASIFGVVSMLVIADRARGTGHFNLAAGGLATMVGIGAALSTTMGGTLIQRAGYGASFRGLALIGVLAFLIVWLAVPETLVKNQPSASSPATEQPAGSGEETLNAFQEPCA
jgi:MFS family permease